MQQRTDTISLESLATFATWSDARLLLEALRELPFTAQADMDEALSKEGLPAIAELTEAVVAERFSEIFLILRNRLAIWRNDLMQQLYDEICIKRDYCSNRHDKDYNFWTDVIPAVAGILGDLGVLALSLILVRRLLDDLCDCG